MILVLEHFSINIYESLIRKRDISFCNLGHFPVLQNIVDVMALGSCGDQKDASLLSCLPRADI